ncbi:MAG TPA: glycosyltransferase, partial [Ilumatobacteraceae bacterium]
MAPPRFSIVTPVYNPPLAALKACIDSVRSQTVTDWEWCIVDDCSTQNGAVELVQYAADLDQRIRF